MLAAIGLAAGVVLHVMALLHVVTGMATAYLVGAALALTLPSLALHDLQALGRGAYPLALAGVWAPVPRWVHALLGVSLAYDLVLMAVFVLSDCPVGMSTMLSSAFSISFCTMSFLTYYGTWKRRKSHGMIIRAS